MSDNTLPANFFDELPSGNAPATATATLPKGFFDELPSANVPKPNVFQQARQKFDPSLSGDGTTQAPRHGVLDRMFGTGTFNHPSPDPNLPAEGQTQFVKGADGVFHPAPAPVAAKPFTYSASGLIAQIAGPPPAGEETPPPNGFFKNLAKGIGYGATVPLENLETRLDAILGQQNGGVDVDVDAQGRATPHERTAAEIGAAGRAGIRENIAAAPQFDPTGVSGHVGPMIGQALPVIATGGGSLAAMLMGLEGSEAGQEEVEAQRAKGVPITTGQQVADVAGQGLLNAGIGMIAPGGRVGKAVLGSVPAANLATRLAIQGGIGATEMAGLQGAGNAITRETGVDPNRPITQGMGWAALGGGLQGVGAQAVHELQAPTVPVAPLRTAPENGEAASGPPTDTNALMAARLATEQAQPKPPEAPNLLQKVAGEHAVAEEYGKPPVEEKPAPLPVTPEGNAFTRIADQAKALAASEEGGDIGTKAFVKQDVLPATDRLISSGKRIATAIDRDMDLGLTTTVKGKQTALNLRKMLGDSEAAGHAFESQLAPYREHVPTFSNDPKAALEWADSVEALGRVPQANEKSQPAVDSLLAMRKQNAERAAKLGVNNLDAEGYGLARLFKSANGAEEKIPGSGPASTNTNKPFRSQKFDTFSEAYDAATKAGLVPAYDSPLDMQIARQYEVERNLAAREIIRHSDNEGTVKWVPDGTKPPVEFGTKLSDPLLARETRRMAAPEWMVGRLSRMDHFDALKYLDSAPMRAKMVDVRPGEEPPQGYSFTGKEVPGTFHSSEDVARFLDGAMTHAVGDPIATAGSKIARAALQMRYLMSVTHGMAALVANTGFHVGEGVRSGSKGSISDVGNSILGALDPFTGLARGREIREELEKPGTHPDLSEVAKRIQAINPGLKLRSVLDKSKWDGVKDAFAAGNPIGGSARAVKMVLQSIGDATYNHILPNIVAGGLRNVAESDIAAGKSQEMGHEGLARANDTLAHMIGHHVRSNEFSSGVEKTVGRILFPAYDLMRGQIENVAGAGKDVANMIPGVKKLPGVSEPGRDAHALAALAGTLATTAIASGIAQMAYTYATTGKAVVPHDRDWWNPQTGRKDANGNEERLTLPGLTPFLMKMAGMAGGKGLANEAYGRLNPLITGGLETARNKDWQGNQVRPEGESALKNTARGVGHTLKGTLPITAMSQFDNPTGEPMTADERIGKALGAQYGHPITSEAEQLAYDILGKNEAAGRTPQQQRDHDNDRRWVQEIREGKREQAIKEMRADKADPSSTMTEVRAKNLLKRATLPPGPEGIAADTRLKPEDLQAIWDKATPQEQAGLRRVIQDRVSKVKSGSPFEIARWKQLRDAIKPVPVGGGGDF